MDRKTQQDFAKRQFPYAVIEAALAAVFDVRTPKQRAKLKAHIKHAQRLGLGSKAGTGARYRYSFDEACQLLFVMLAGEIDVPPAVSVKTITRVWPRMQRWFAQAIDDEARAGKSIWLTLRPQPMAGWTRSGTIEWIGAFRADSPYTVLTKLNDTEWLCARNLSAVMLKFEAALKREGSSGSS
jgi:hypothetical protein